MKRLFVFVPAIVLVLFLLNSFVLKEKERGEEIIELAKSSATVTLQDKLFINPFAKVTAGNGKSNKSKPLNLLIKSTDGGQTWQDISKALPETEQRIDFFAGESELYLHVKNAMYRSKSNLKIPVWVMVDVPDLQSASSRPSTSIAFNGSGVIAFNYDGHVYQKTPAVKNWLPLYSNFKKPSLRTVFTSADGTVFLGYDHGLYKSTDKGKNWKQVQKGMVMNVIESQGVLLATAGNGIIRSTDNGEHWQWVINEGGVGIAVERIKGGFAAISYNAITKSRRIHISLDGGKTWQLLMEDSRLPH